MNIQEKIVTSGLTILTGLVVVVMSYAMLIN